MRRFKPRSCKHPLKGVTTSRWARASHGATEPRSAVSPSARCREAWREWSQDLSSSLSPEKVGAGTLIPGRPRLLQDEGGSPWATFGTSRLFRTILRTDETCSTRSTCWQCWKDQWGWGAGRPVLLLEGLSGVSPGVGSAQLCHTLCCLWVKRPLQNQSRQIGKQTSRLKLGDDHSP